MKSLTIVAGVAVLTLGCSFPFGSEPDDRTFSQVDITGRPAIATVFLPSDQKDPFNRSIPSEQRATFKQFVTGFLETVAGYTPGNASDLADVLLPDILGVDLGQPTTYLNGRLPSDDVVTASLMLVFGAGTPVSDDNVDANDVALPNTFPYLAGAHR